MCKKIKSKDSVEGRLSPPIRVLSPSDLAWAAKGFTGLLALLIMDYPWSWLEMLHRLQLQRAQNRSWQRCIYSGRLFASKCSSACICSTMCAFVTPVDQRDVWLSHTVTLELFRHQLNSPQSWPAREWPWHGGFLSLPLQSGSLFWTFWRTAACGVKILPMRVEAWLDRWIYSFTHAVFGIIKSIAATHSHTTKLSIFSSRMRRNGSSIMYLPLSLSLTILNSHSVTQCSNVPLPWPFLPPLSVQPEHEPHTPHTQLFSQYVQPLLHLELLSWLKGETCPAVRSL